MRAVLAAALALGAAEAMPVTLQSRFMSKVGRQEWLQNHTVVEWSVPTQLPPLPPSAERWERPRNPAETAIVVVDMWNVHWCHTATTRVGEIAVPMNVRSPPHPTSPHPPAEVQLLSP